MIQDFLADNNVCGQTILQLVSRGNAIIAEILRLKHYIPNVFRLNKQDSQKYGDIIQDFSYLKAAEAHDSKIESNDVLRDLDEEFKCNHIEIIKRFYLAFESIHTYITDLNHYIDELEDGYYIHQSLENVFTDMEGKQLLCEALYLYGAMLLMVDAHIEGIIRERLLVSYYRYTPQRRDTASCIDEVCKLLRETGLSATKKPNNYPEDYFRRIPIKEFYIDLVIGKLRSDDIYNQLTVYPLARHRSTALTSQAAMLCICLFFSPHTLHSQTAIMREIVDKYFPDNWVIALYMGFTINLVESWEYFKAAKLALNNTLEAVNIKNYANANGKAVQKHLTTTTRLLKEGTLTKDNLLQNINNTINALRDCNVVIRWLMLHTIARKVDRSKKAKQLRELVIVESKYNAVEVFKLLLNTAQLELIVKDIFKTLLQDKQNNWEVMRSESFSSLMEISEVFSGTKPLTRVQKNENLEVWFKEISKQVERLQQDDDTSSMKIVQLMQALEEVQEFHELNSQLQIIQYLKEIRKNLDRMLRNMKVNEDVLITMQIIGDLSYAWELIDTYTPIMQTGIKAEPTLVIKLRAVFLKLASALEIPLLRINQAHSEDLISVSQYYSNELEIYIRMVLQIMPKMMFEKMARIIQMQTTVLKELPTRLEKDKVKEYAQLNERFEFAHLTHSISVFSQGMRMMKSTLVGVVCLDPKKLLEDGIRKELVQHIAHSLHVEIAFTGRNKNEELDQKLKRIGLIMDGYKRSFEYIQDYVNVNGLKIWQEEITRIINYNVEQECNGFLRNKVHDWESAFQSRYVPIPHYAPTDSISENFVGRLAREILRITDPKSTLYIEQTSTWYDMKTQKIIANKQTIAMIMYAIEVTGLVGLDRLFSFMIVSNLNKILDIFDNKITKNASWTTTSATIQKEMKSLDESSINPQKVYQNAIAKASKLYNGMLDHLLNIGQLQILRNIIAFNLNSTCKFDAKNLESSLSSLNKALILDFTNDNCTSRPSEELMEKLSQYFDYAGMNNPFNKIYVNAKADGACAFNLFVFTLMHLQKMFLYQTPGLTAKKNNEMDGAVFCTGLHTFIKQLNFDLGKIYIEFMCKYAVHLSKYAMSIKNDIPLEATLALKLLDATTSFSEESRAHFQKCIPKEIIHLLQTITEK